MALVYGTDSNVGVAIGEQSAWDTVATTFFRLPILNESLKVTRDPFTDVEEFGTTGGRETIEFGRSYTEGEIQCIGRYDSVAFNLLLGHLMGSEERVAVTLPDRAGTTASVTGDSHWYTFKQALPNGLTIRVYKQGKTTTGMKESYKNVLITGCTIDQPEGDVCRFTFRFVGTDIDSTDSTAMGAVPTTGGGNRIMKARDLVYDASYRKKAECVSGSGYTNNLKLKSFTLVINRNIQPPPTFITDPDAIAKPGIVGLREVTFDFESYLEAVLTSDADYPLNEYRNKTDTQISILYNDNSLVGTYPRMLRLELPAFNWESVTAPLSGAEEVPLSGSGRSKLALPADCDPNNDIPSVSTEFKLATYCATGDVSGAPGSGSSKFSGVLPVAD